MDQGQSVEALPSDQNPSSGHEQPRLTRQQKRLRRQRLAKLYARAAAQESSHSEAAEDYVLQQAYEQHLRQLQQHHPEAHGSDSRQGRQQEQGARGKAVHKRGPQGGQQQQQQQQRSAFGGSKRRRRGGGDGTGGGPGGAAGSVDTLTSSAALAVPAAQPAQQLAHISELRESPRGQQEQRQPLAGPPAEGLAPAGLLATPAAPACGAPVPGGEAAGEDGSSGSPRRLDWSAPAALVGQALMQRQEVEVAAEVAAKMAGVCRLDMSAAALLIGSQLAPGTAQQLPRPEPAAPAAGLPAAAVGVEDAAAHEQVEVEDATAGTAAAAAGPGGAQRQRRGPAVHGNYHRYYGYRFFGDQRPEDPRLAVFERTWFARRRCLDVGCNEGLITLALAQRYHPRSMLGVDIDGALIARACRHLREAHTSATERARLVRRAGVQPQERKQAIAAAASLGQTRFVHSDFLDSQVAGASLDTITCLSVTKWVHLNRGDAGLQAMFGAFWAALAPGGLLLLEPQPWSSYRAAAGKVRCEQAPPGSFFHRQDELRLRPAQFADYLCEQLGFCLVRRFGVEESAAGFDRPLLLLRKPH